MRLDQDAASMGPARAVDVSRARAMHQGTAEGTTKAIRRSRRQHSSRLSEQGHAASPSSSGLGPVGFSP